MRRPATLLATFAIVVAFSYPAHALKPARSEPGLAPDLVLEGICPFPVLLHDVVNTFHITDYFDRDGNLLRSKGNGHIIEDVSRSRTCPA